MSTLKRYRNTLRTPEWHDQLTGIIDQINAKLGIRDPRKVDVVTPQSPAKPIGVLLSVAAASGIFTVSILNPQDVIPLTANLRSAKAQRGFNSLLTPILHNVQSAQNLNFDSSSGLSDYGSTPQTTIALSLGTGLSLYWRWRSSFDGQNWNTWQVFGGPSGPVAVQS